MEALDSCSPNTAFTRQASSVFVRLCLYHCCLFASQVLVSVPNGPRLVVSEASPAVVKSYTLALATNPVVPVVVTLASPGLGSYFTASPAAITFTASTWSTPITVTVRAR
jgi:hypothetical protein